MNKTLIYFIVFVFFEIAYAVRAFPYNELEGALLCAGVIIAVVCFRNWRNEWHVKDGNK